MIEVKVEDSGIINCATKGKLSVLIEDSISAVRAIYIAIMQQSKTGAKIFKKMFIKHLNMAFDKDMIGTIMDENAIVSSKDDLLKGFHEAAEELLKTLTEDD